MNIFIIPELVKKTKSIKFLSYLNYFYFKQQQANVISTFEMNWKSKNQDQTDLQIILSHQLQWSLKI